MYVCIYIYIYIINLLLGFPGGWLSGEESPCNAGDSEMWAWSLGQEDTLEEKMATYSGNLAWNIPQTEESSRLQSMGLQRVGYDWLNNKNLSLR